MPLTAQIYYMKQLEGSLQSVGVDGMTSKNYAIYNQRMVVLMEAPYVGQFAFVAIGALCVGSVTIEALNGTTVEKGTELGYFLFGGSTVALVFQPGTVRLEDDVFLHSINKVEAYSFVGMRVASIAGNVTANGITYTNDLTPS